MITPDNRNGNEADATSSTLVFDQSRFREAVSFSFDINDAKTNQLTEHSNKYTTFNGHEIDAYEVFSGDGVHLMHSKLNSSRNGNIRVLAHAPYIHFVFVIQCARSYQIAGSDMPALRINELKHQAFIMQADASLHVQWFADPGVEYFELSIDLGYFNSLLPEQHFLFSRVQDAMERCASTHLYDQSLPIWPLLKTTLHEMVYNKLDGFSKSMFIKAKIMEMLSIQQSKYEKLSAVDDTPLSLQEKEKMHLAKRIILERLDTPHSLNELAQLVGTNECYLKTHFKQVFGTTVYGYINQTKMEKARKLLKNKDKKISEVAHLVGYKHAAHFTAAFKKYFGYTPNKI